MVCVVPTVQSVVNPHLDLRSSTTIQCHMVYPPFAPDLQIRICHCPWHVSRSLCHKWNYTAKLMWRSSSVQTAFFPQHISKFLHAYCMYLQGGRGSSSAGSSNLWPLVDLSGIEGSRVVARWHTGRMERFSLTPMYACLTAAVLTLSGMGASWEQLGKMPHAGPTAAKKFNVKVL